MTEELKPCPFCGGTNVTMARIPTWDTRSWRYVSCRNSDCQAEGPADLRESGAIEKWNTRAVDALESPLPD